MVVLRETQFDVAVAVITNLSIWMLTVFVIRRFIGARFRLSYLQWHLISEFCCSFLTSMVSLERSLIKARYGVLGYILASILAGVMYSHVADGLLSSPSTALNRFLRRQITKKYMLYAILAQVAGAFVSYAAIRSIWLIGLSSLHRKKALSVHVCSSPLQVSTINGFLIEGTLTFISAMASSFAPRGEAGRIFNATISVTLVLLGLSYTGAMFHPSLAITLILGCKGIGLWQFLFIYWLGPACGVITANLINDTFGRIQYGPIEQSPDLHSSVKVTKGAADQTQQEEFACEESDDEGEDNEDSDDSLKRKKDK